MTKNTEPSPTTHRETRTEVFPTIHGLPLRLSFTPDAIREHFEDDDSPEAQAVQRMSEDDLVSVALLALNDDDLYDVFHSVLNLAVQRVAGLSPAGIW